MHNYIHYLLNFGENLSVNFSSFSGTVMPYWNETQLREPQQYEILEPKQRSGV